MITHPQKGSVKISDLSNKHLVMQGRMWGGGQCWRWTNGLNKEKRGRKLLKNRKHARQNIDLFCYKRSLGAFLSYSK